MFWILLIIYTPALGNSITLLFLPVQQRVTSRFSRHFKTFELWIWRKYIHILFPLQSFSKMTFRNISFRIIQHPMAGIIGYAISYSNGPHHASTPETQNVKRYIGKTKVLKSLETASRISRNLIISSGIISIRANPPWSRHTHYLNPFKWRKLRLIHSS